MALGVAAHINARGEELPMPRCIVAVSPGEVPWNDAERAIMKKNNPKDMMVDYAFMEKVEKFERHGRDDVPEYMIHCYPMLPYFKEAKEDFAEIVAYLAE